MKIAQIAPIIESVPPSKYGGTERVVYELTEELVKRGHDVTLFASGDSKTSAKLVSVVSTSLRKAKIESRADGASSLSLQNIGLAYQRQEEFDIIHDHTHVLGLPTANLAKTPVVVTMHDPIFPHSRPLLETLTNPHIVTISKAQSKPAPLMNNIGTVYNGLTMNHYPFSPKHRGYLLFFGTFRKEKGAHEAIKAAKHLDLPLILAGKLDDWQYEYFQKEVKPFLSEKIMYIGEVNEKERNKLMGGAMCLLHPISWLEPFGLTLIESMACGTPVVAYNRGSSPEIITDGETGYIVDTLDEMVAAVKKIDKINRKKCRDHALTQFNAQRMTDGYEKIYRKVLSQSILDVKMPAISTSSKIPSIRQFTFSPDFS